MEYITSIVDKVLANPDFTIDTHMFPSMLFEQMELDINKTIGGDIAAVVSSVAFFNWINRVKARSPKYYILSICLDWDEIGIDLINSDNKKISCISWMAPSFIKALLLYMQNNNVPIKTYEITFADAMDIVNEWL